MEMAMEGTAAVLITISVVILPQLGAHRFLCALAIYYPASPWTISNLTLPVGIFLTALYAAEQTSGVSALLCLAQLLLVWEKSYQVQE